MGRGRRVLPWVIAAVAVLLAAIALGVLVVSEASEPKLVAQLTPQGCPDPGSSRAVVKAVDLGLDPLIGNDRQGAIPVRYPARPRRPGGRSPRVRAFATSLGRC